MTDAIIFMPDGREAEPQPNAITSQVARCGTARVGPHEHAE
jgi:hypothetical protein